MFERYTEQARRAIFFARFEAIHRRADKISTAHLLLALSLEESSRAVSIGSLKDKIVELCAVLGLPHRPCTEIPYRQNVDIPLDNNSKITLAYAVEEADRDRQFWIDTDHLLRGLLRFPNEAASALHTISLNLAIAREASKHHRIEFPPPRVATIKRVHMLAQNARRSLLPPLVKLAIIALVSFIGVLILRYLQ